MSNTNIVIHEYTNNNKQIIILSLNRPKHLNAMNKDLLRELREQIEKVQMKNHIDTLIITSEITKSFCSGIDVGYVRELSNEQAADFFYDLADTLEMIINLPCLTIAVVNGYAFGAGADLALACDLRIGSTDASFRFPGPQFGVILGTKRLMNEVGPSIARRLVLLGETFDAEKAYQYGIIHGIIENSNCFKTALEWADKVSHIPKHAQEVIKDICAFQLENVNSALLAKNSILEGHFRNRFREYVGRVKKS
ncbi:enoyl-CoA hydratase/isomerase family protein, partial [Bacillus sp. JJ1503]|uniref:enoyl-CoA hydratase/isomerase family protein n=1 Tax=Bacillus sp. JJ1503 TaxID=3122956 RepID=UPI002FFEB11C